MKTKNKQIDLRKQPTLYDEELKLEFLTQKGDPLERLDKIIPWEIFKNQIKRIFDKKQAGPGGRKRFDFIMMFKILILQRYYNLSDEQTEYQLNDRISFQQFIGVRMANKIPDATTVWLFKEHLIKSVGIGDDGRFRELNHKEREEMKLREAMKVDIEKNIRNFKRLWYGDEDMDKKEFRLCDFGIC